jgi:C4-dicarboxylate-specific signal transduction histidine kinase
MVRRISEPIREWIFEEEMPKKADGGENMNSENIEVWEDSIGTAFRHADRDAPSSGDVSTEFSSALLTPYWFTEERKRERDRLQAIVEQNAALIEQLALMNAKLEAQIAGRKQAEAALWQAQADLAHANRVSSLGELTASLAHEIIEPIAAAVTNADACFRWLSRDQPDLAEARSAASRVAQEGRRAGEIVNQAHLLFERGTLQR